MRVDACLAKLPPSSFQSCEKDAYEILKKLFVTSRPFDAELKRLLIINEKDCLDNLSNEVYNSAIDKASLKYLIDNDYVKLIPRFKNNEFENFKSQILLSFDNFTPNETNPEFRDCIVHIDILCPYENWDLGDFRLRPFKIAGYIDGLLNNCKLSGIGRLNFMGGTSLAPSSEIGGFSLMYAAIHGNDDKIPLNE